MKEHTGINPWRAEEKIVKVMGYISVPQTIDSEVIKGLNFSKIQAGQATIKMTWKDTRNAKHEVELVGVVIKNRFEWLRKYFNGLAPVFAIDILVDGKSVLKSEHFEGESWA